MIYLSIIFFILAASCNAVMDTLIHHHNTSIFRKHLSGFWSDGYLTSWRNKYIDGDFTKGRKKLFWIINYPVQLTDAWHFFKSLMIVFICLSIATFNPNQVYVSNYGYITIIIIYGIIWNITFNIFYNHLLRIKLH